MPQLSDLLNKRPDKKFVKKSYRPWDLSGTGTVDNIDKSIETNCSESEKENPPIPVSVNNISPEVEPVVIGNKTGNELGNKQITVKRPIDNELGNKQVTYRKQIENDSGDDLDNAEKTIFLTDSIRTLTGIQRKIFFYVIDLCSSRGQLHTNAILTTDIAAIANCSFGSAKTSLIRLINKNLLLRKKGKTSRGGHIVLGITKEVQAAALQAQRLSLNVREHHLDNAIGNNIDNKLSNNGTSSSNIYINTTTKNIALPEDWLTINFEPLHQIGFSLTQITQLYSQALNVPEIIQESIYHFAFGLENNPNVKAYPQPLYVLMGVLRKGQAWVENNYQSPQEIAQRELIERKKAELERKRQLEDDAFQLGLEEWKESLSTEEFEKITEKRAGDVTPKPVKISLYFKEYVWPNVKKNYLVT